MNQPSTIHSEDATALLSQAGGYLEARMARTFAHQPETLWSMLISPPQLAQWLAPGEIEPKLGGRARLDFVDSGIVIDSKVTAYDEGRTLQYDWSGAGEPSRPIRWEIAPLPEGATLTLIVRVPDSEDAARAIAGWEAHLDMLAAALEGAAMKFPFMRFKAARDIYNEKIASMARA